MNKIKIDFRFIKGTFDIYNGKLCCVQHKHGDVDLCLVDGMNFSFAQILLQSGNVNSNPEVLEGAVKLGNEIANRWNNFNAMEKEVSRLRGCMEAFLFEAEGLIASNPELKEVVGRRIVGGLESNV